MRLNSSLRCRAGRVSMDMIARARQRFLIALITPKPLMNEGNLKINSEGTYSIVNRQITTLINNYIEIK